jgi:hypothetical protein
MPKTDKPLTEKFVQDSIIEYLFHKGWSRNLRSKTEKEHGVDIKVRHNKYARYWLIEVKGESKNAKNPYASLESNFYHALGQIISRMWTNRKRGYKYGYKYGVGYPYSLRNKVIKNLPHDVCDKLNLYVFLVDENRKVELIDWKKLKTIQSSK